jgi:hypothetical protein
MLAGKPHAAGSIAAFLVSIAQESRAHSPFPAAGVEAETRYLPLTGPLETAR